MPFNEFSHAGLLITLCESSLPTNFIYSLPVNCYSNNLSEQEVSVWNTFLHIELEMATAFLE